MTGRTMISSRAARDAAARLLVSAHPDQGDRKIMPSMASVSRHERWWPLMLEDPRWYPHIYLRGI
jgi:hypothetical protein